jgi:hypothetical protein
MGRDGRRRWALGGSGGVCPRGLARKVALYFLIRELGRVDRRLDDTVRLVA